MTKFNNFDNREEMYKLLDTQAEIISDLEEENKKLKLKIENFDFSWTQNNITFEEDKLYIRDVHTEIHLTKGHLKITVFVPSIEEIFKIHYYVTGKKNITRGYSE